MKIYSRLGACAITLAASVLILGGCQKSSGGGDTSSSAETAQQVGDQASSIDEASSGGSRVMQSARRTFARLSPGEMLTSDNESNDRTSCLFNAGFSVCAGGLRTLTLGDCTLLGAVFSGTVKLTFSDTLACHFSAVNDTIARDPEYSITGLFGGTYAVSKTGANGQLLTKTGTTTATFSNDGIKRTFTRNNTKLYDFTTTTTAAITISNPAGLLVRNGRVVTGGTLHIVNNVDSTSCDLSPTNLTWGATCSCPISGSVAGTCGSGTGSVTFTSTCGTATATINGTTSTVVLDRCFTI